MKKTIVKKIFPAVLAVLCVAAVPTGLHARDMRVSASGAESAAIREIKRSNDAVSCIVADLTPKDAERIISHIEKTRFRYWRNVPVQYGLEIRGDDVRATLYVYPKTARPLLKVNELIESKASSVVRKARLKKNSSAKSKATKIAVAAADLLRYEMFDSANPEASSLRNLKKNRGCCLVYSLIYQAACDKAGLRCRVCVGTARGGLHSWNRVRVNGKWKYVDACWYDTTNGDRRYLLSTRLWSSHRVRSQNRTWYGA